MGDAMKILVVENSPHICTRLLALLADSGQFSVSKCVATVAEALEQAASEPPDAILLDLSLDDGNGFTVLETLRRQGSKLPVIILTESEGRQYLARAQALAADAFLRKSSQFEDILPTLMRLLRVSRTSGDCTP